VSTGLEVVELAVSYGGVHALDDVSFTAAPGEVVGFIGPNGSGKTTLLDVISGHIRPDRGRVMLDGIDLVDHLPEDRASLGLVRSFQDCRLFPDLTVEETLLAAEDARRPAGLLSTALGLPWARRREREKRTNVDALIESMSLSRFRDNAISELSTGTRRVVDLAAVLGGRPRLLLLDEPTAGIAQRDAEAFGPLLRQLHELTGSTILLVEHDVPLTLSLCDRIVVMEAGQIVASGAPSEIVYDPAARAAYLGASDEALARSGVPVSARRR
jgi:ABC-type branched-subunit amino acid transport system ATPase component